MYIIFLFILQLLFLPTYDSYKCGGVALWRCGGWGEGGGSLSCGSNINKTLFFSLYLLAV